MLRKVDYRTAEQVAEAMIELLKPISEHVHSITSDNGKEFAEHQKIAKALQTEFFFAHPYSAWERGANENMNGLVRQYIPKSHDFDHLSDSDLLWIMNRLNNRPRKCLEFLTPLEVFLESSVALIT